MLTKIYKQLSLVLAKRNRAFASGFTLIEVLVTIVVISIAATAIMGVFINTVKTSADPLIQQQAIAIAEAYMEEIQSRKFCEDVSPPMSLPPPQSIPSCVTETGGSEGAQSRSTFDDIQDYNDPVVVDGVVRDQNYVAIAGRGGYSIAVVVSAAALGVTSEGSGNAMRIDITVSHAAIDPITLSGFRANY